MRSVREGCPWSPFEFCTWRCWQAAMSSLSIGVADAPLPPLSCKSSACHSTDKLQIAGGFLVGLLFVMIIAGLIAIMWWLCRRLRSRIKADRPIVLLRTGHIHLTWEDLHRATAGFSPAKIVGYGGSSTVYKGRLPSGRHIAIKILREDLIFGTPKQLFLTELAVLGKLRHRNLVRIVSYFNNSKSMAIILDYMPVGSLDALLHTSTSANHRSRGYANNMVDWDARLRILVGVAEGLAYLHHEYDGKLCVIHGDLKPSNVLLDEHMEAHIADFGLSTIVGAFNTTIGLSMHCWSVGYTAPECLQQGMMSRKADVFSFGVIILEVMTGERPSSKRLKEGESLVGWVSKALAEEAIESVVAPALLGLQGNHSMMWSGEDMSAILGMGCRCASFTRGNRPDMEEVVKFLRRLGENLTYK